MRFVVYGFEHPAQQAQVLGRYRWKWLAELNAWLFKNTSTLWPDAWVKEEEEILN